MHENSAGLQYFISLRYMHTHVDLSCCIAEHQKFELNKEKHDFLKRKMYNEVNKMGKKCVRKEENDNVK